MNHKKRQNLRLIYPTEILHVEAQDRMWGNGEQEMIAFEMSCILASTFSAKLGLYIEGLLTRMSSCYGSAGDVDRPSPGQ